MKPKHWTLVVFSLIFAAVIIVYVNQPIADSSPVAIPRHVNTEVVPLVVYKDPGLGYSLSYPQNWFTTSLNNNVYFSNQSFSTSWNAMNLKPGQIVLGFKAELSLDAGKGLLQSVKNQNSKLSATFEQLKLSNTKTGVKMSYNNKGIPSVSFMVPYSSKKYLQFDLLGQDTNGQAQTIISTYSNK